MSFAGELNDLGLSDIFQILAISKRTGTLTVTSTTCRGQALFAGGLVVAGGLNPYPSDVLSYCRAMGVCLGQAASASDAASVEDIQGAAVLEYLGGANEAVLQALTKLLAEMMGHLLRLKQGSFHFASSKRVDSLQSLRLQGSYAICPSGLQAQFLAMEALRIKDEAKVSQGVAPPLTAAAADAGHPRACANSTLTNIGGLAPPADDVAQHRDALQDVRDVLLQLRKLPHGRTPCALLLRALQLHCERGAYFAVSDGELVGQGGFGAAPSGRLVAPQVKGTRVRVPQGSVLQQLLQTKRPQLGPAPKEAAQRALFDAMGGGFFGQPLLMAPFCSGGEVVGLLVGDNPSGQPLIDAPGVDIIIAQGAAKAPVAPATRS